MEENKKLWLYGVLGIALILIGLFMYKFEGSHQTGLASAQNYVGPFFEVSVEIPEEYNEITAGEDLLTSIELKNLGEGSRMDVILNYLIKDSDGNEILRQSETVAVETENGFVRYFNLPLNSETGRYIIEVTLLYSGDKETKSEASFKVVE